MVHLELNCQPACSLLAELELEGTCWCWQVKTDRLGRASDLCSGFLCPTADPEESNIPCYREIVKKSITSISARFLSGFIEACGGRFAISFSMKGSSSHSQDLQCLLLYPGTAPDSKTLSVWAITKYCSMTSPIRDPRTQITAPKVMEQKAPLPRHTHIHIILPWIQFLGIDSV